MQKKLANLKKKSSSRNVQKRKTLLTNETVTRMTETILFQVFGAFHSLSFSIFFYISFFIPFFYFYLSFFIPFFSFLYLLLYLFLLYFYLSSFYILLIFCLITFYWTNSWILFPPKNLCRRKKKLFQQILIFVLSEWWENIPLFF